MTQEVKVVVVNFTYDNQIAKIEEFNGIVNDMLSGGWNFLYKPKTTGAGNDLAARFVITAWFVRNRP